MHVMKRLRRTVETVNGLCALRADNVGSLGAVVNGKTKKELLNIKECLHVPTTS